MMIPGDKAHAPHRCLLCPNLLPFRNYFEATKHLADEHWEELEASGGIKDNFLQRLPTEAEERAATLPPPPFYCRMELEGGEPCTTRLLKLDSMLSHLKNTHDIFRPLHPEHFWTDADKLEHQAQLLRDAAAAGERFKLALDSLRDVGDFLVDCGELAPVEDEVQQTGWVAQ